MDVTSLVIPILSATEMLVERCEEVQQCHNEAVRLESRIRKLIDMLSAAKGSFGNDRDVEKRLMELHKYLGTLSPLLEECKWPVQMLKILRYFQKAPKLADNLRRKEAELEILRGGLHTAMLPFLAHQGGDIARQLRDMSGDMKSMLAQQRVNTKSVLDTMLGEIQQATGLLARVARTGRLQGKVCWDKLMKEDKVLGEGTFGIILSGTYFGQHVAMKQAKLNYAPPNIENDFRYVCFCPKCFYLHSRVSSD